MKNASSPSRHAFRSVATVCLLVVVNTAALVAADDAPPTPANATTVTFDDDAADTPPNDFLPGRPGKGGNAEWKIVQNVDSPSAPHSMAQMSAVQIRARYPHIVHSSFVAADVDVSVKFKTLTGTLDQSAGIVFRYRDSKNYYVVRASALDNNVAAYKHELGRPTNLGVKGKETAFGVETRVLPRRWNTLRVIAKGTHMQVYLNGKKLFEFEDDTFPGPGRVGVSTKADSVTHFDDFVAGEP
jgi:hypothetical protein